MITDKHLRLNLSDESYDYLVETARQLGYVRAIHSSQGLYRFIAAISEHSFEDTRPSNVQGTDQWYTGLSSLRERAVSVPPETRRAYTEIAAEWHIGPYPTQKAALYGVERPRFSRLEANKDLRQKQWVANLLTYTETARMAPVLEAIGLRWLTPTESWYNAPPEDALWRTRLSKGGRQPISRFKRGAVPK